MILQLSATFLRQTNQYLKIHYSKIIINFQFWSEWFIHDVCSSHKNCFVVLFNQYFRNVLGVTYNIPVCLWIIDTHPYNPPMVFVKPTSTMQIKPGKHVDTNGRVYLPYLNEWRHVSEFTIHIWKA